MSGPGRWFIFQGYISGKLPNAPHIRDNRSTHVKAVPSDQSFILEITSSLIENPAELGVDLHGCHVFNVHFSDAFLFVYKIFSSAASTFIHICEL